jgi:NAD-dependent deacetylase
LPDQAVVELHGNAHWVACLHCRVRYTRESVHVRVLAGDEEPVCLECGGMLKATTVSFGQPLPEDAVAHAQELHATARLCLVIGSSLVVYPAAALPELTRDAGGLLAIVNYTPTHLDHFAALVSRSAAGKLLADSAASISPALPD